MEESVWMYFGIILVIVALAILTSVFITYDRDTAEQQAFVSLRQLNRQIEVICKSPRDTRLTALMQMPANSTLFAEEDRICLSFHSQTRCEPTSCSVERGILLDLSDVTEFRTHEYQCAVLRGENLTVNCQG